MAELAFWSSRRSSIKTVIWTILYLCLPYALGLKVRDQDLVNFLKQLDKNNDNNIDVQELFDYIQGKESAATEFQQGKGKDHQTVEGYLIKRARIEFYSFRWLGF